LKLSLSMFVFGSFLVQYKTRPMKLDIKLTNLEPQLTKIEALIWLEISNCSY
jgi:hypothetical protein